jgi:hypothetical protein
MAVALKEVFVFYGPTFHSNDCVSGLRQPTATPEMVTQREY